MKQPLYINFWGKADAETGRWHPLAYHMLDVAAVAREVLEANETYLNRWSDKLRLSPETVLDVVSFFAAIHDLGKFAADFQWKREDLAIKLQSRITAPPSFSKHHTQAGWILWNGATEKGIKDLFLKNLKPKPEGRPSTIINALLPLFSAAFGHHGAPVDSPLEAENFYKSIFDQGEGGAAKGLFHELLGLFPGVGTLFQPEQDAKRRAQDFIALSFSLSGLIILADWTASSEENFPLVCKTEDLTGNSPYGVITGFENIDTYSRHSLNMAEQAIKKQGLIPSSVYPESDWQRLFPEIAKKYQPNPLQKQMLEMQLPAGQGLYILEDIAGSGKTEAALLLVARLLARNEANGFYFALPTMATSNGMYSRISNNYTKFFVDGSNPSLILSHGASRLHKDFAKSILPEIKKRDSNNQDYNESGSTKSDNMMLDSTAACNAWFADRSKKVFLAEIGVGSIDQALLAAIYSKHNTLRLYGLSDRILIVDEVHAYDIYMQQLLENLVHFQASMGQSVILLSATLPLKIKEKLITAFKKGIRISSQDEEGSGKFETDEEAYPLLTIVSKNEDDKKIPIEARNESVRHVNARFLADENSVFEILHQTHQSGKCALWIRNTVADVQNGYDQLREKINPDKLMMFHSRFTMFDRQKIETDVLSKFGKESGSVERNGCILVASQVVEQSLDLDFDVMITDLCPVDLVIQRAGRLCRHSRDTQGNRKDGADERGMPTLYVFGPDPDQKPNIEIQSDWYSSIFKGGTYVYPDVGKLWRTAKVLKNAGKIKMPDDARFLIESVYAENAALKIPLNLIEATKIAEDKDNTKESAGVHNCFPPEKGFIRPSDRDPFNEDERPVTRLTEDTATYRLCLVQDDRLIPFNQTPNYPWAMSELKYRYLRLEYDALLKKIIENTNKELFDRGRGGILLPMEIVSTQVTGKEDSGKSVTYQSIGCLEKGKRMVYDNRLGLRVEK